MALKTPVVVLIYNRPDHTKQVFDAIKLIKPAELYIVADGPKDNSDWQNCKNSRQIFVNCDWPVSIHKNYSDINMGIANRIISGLDWVFEHVERAIIFEDDCVPNTTFFRFCEELLDYYQNDDKVMYIAGSNLGQKISSPYSYEFTNFAMFWGWATWAKSWQKHNHDLNTWQKHLPKLKNNISPKNQLMFEILSGEIYAKRITWDISWNADVWLNTAVGIVPVNNLVKNIGFDGHSSNFDNPKSQFAMLPTTDLKFPLLHPKSKDPTASKVMEEAFFKLMPETFPGIYRK